MVLSTVPTSPDAASGPAPAWLVDFVLSPPAWVNTVLQAAALVTVVVVAYRLYQWEGDLPLDVQHEMQVIAGHITAAVTGTLAMINLASLPYMLDVGLGFAAGYVTVLALQLAPVASRLPLPDDKRERVAAKWLVIALAVVGLPIVVATNGEGMAVTKSRYLLAGIAVILMAYNTAILSDENGGVEEQSATE